MAELWNKELYDKKIGALLLDFCDMMQTSFNFDSYTMQDLRKDSQQTFYAALNYCYERTFSKDNYILKDHENKITIKNNPYTTYSFANAYNYNVILDISDVLIKYANILDKIVNLYSLSILTGINIATIYSWVNIDDRLNKKCIDVVKKLYKNEEETLAARISDGRHNPVGCIAILNHKHNYGEALQIGGETSPNNQKMLAALPRVAFIQDTAEGGSVADDPE